MDELSCIIFCVNASEGSWWSMTPVKVIVNTHWCKTEALRSFTVRHLVLKEWMKRHNKSARLLTLVTEN